MRLKLYSNRPNSTAETVGALCEGEEKEVQRERAGVHGMTKTCCRLHREMVPRLTNTLGIPYIFVVELRYVRH
jgi:hypothetical protein